MISSRMENLKTKPKLSHLTIALLVTILPPALSRNSPPMITDQPKENEKVFDARTNVVLPCVADAHPPPIYSWYRFGLLFDPSGSQGRISIMPDTGSLVFTEATKEDEGQYQCNVTNKFGTAMSNTIYLRMGILEKFPNKPIRYEVVARKRSLTLTCNPPRSLPQAHVFWTVGTTGQLPNTKRRT